MATTLFTLVFSVSWWLTLGAAALAACAAERAPELDVIGQVPAFAFTDQTGAPVTERDLVGSVSIVNFVFTRCPTVCPVTSMKMQRIDEKLQGDDVRLVSFSVDPEHDTPPVLAEFAARYGAAVPRWRFLTGPRGEVERAVEDGFKLALERRGELAGGVPDLVHGVHFVLVDPALRIRGYYDSDDAERLDRLVRDARSLAHR